MKASELIKHLQELIAEHGDGPVEVVTLDHFDTEKRRTSMELTWEDCGCPFVVIDTSRARR